MTGEGLLGLHAGTVKAEAGVDAFGAGNRGSSPSRAMGLLRVDDDVPTESDVYDLHGGGSCGHDTNNHAAEDPALPLLGGVLPARDCLDHGLSGCGQ
eukprot:5191253-Pyramimonas_sp.AAC.1